MTTIARGVMTDSPTGRSLVGRAAELAAITEFLDRAAAEGGALLLDGEPGVGKTALLRAAAAHAAAAGTRVVRAEGIEFEATTVCSGLSQALLPLAGGLDGLNPAHREALAVALGLVGGAHAQRAEVAYAALNLLRAAGAERPLLLVVDDLQWVDRYSADVLSFVARRLGGSRVGLLAAGRSGAGGTNAPAGLPRLDLATLPQDAASRLLRSRFPGLAPRVRQRLLDEAQGNPLALLELPPALSGRQGASWQSLPAVLPLSDRLQALYAARVTDLPAPTRELLLLAVLYGPGDYAVLDEATGGRLLADLAPAERAGLVRADDAARQLVFRHPLTRSAVIGLSTAQERRQAHQQLADALVDRPERHCWHLAEATLAPDETVAALLERTADDILRRGDPFSAAAAVTRAADLSPAAVDRGRRLAAAAFIGGTLGAQFGGVPSLLAEARLTPLDAAAELHAVAASAFVMLNGDDEIDAIHRLVVAAVDAYGADFSAGDPPLVAALDTLLQVCYYGGRPELWQPYVAAVARLAPGMAREGLVLSHLFPDPARASPAVLAELDAAVADLNKAVDIEGLGHISGASIYVDRLPGCREPLRRLIRDEPADGAFMHTIGARANLMDDCLTAGRWEEAEQLGREGLASCVANGNLMFRQGFHYLRGMLAAATGDHARAEELAAGLVDWGAPRGAHLAEIWAGLVRTLDAIGRGDAEEAYRCAAAISPPGTLPPYCGSALRVCLDLVEAAARTGRTADARAHAEAMRVAGLPAISPRLDFLTRACTALAADGDDATALFEDALGMPDVRRWPFEAARVQLAYGERLRRGHASAAARPQLAAAAATFDRLGAAPWAARAEAELRAVGRAGTEALTAQEYEIAALAAAGLTNRQIGERLYLSHRTVSTHLYRLFPKLGVTTRAALRDALAATPPG